MQDWYAPLEEHTSPESERKKRKPGKASWRIGGAILLVVLLIAASSLIFSGSNQRTEAPYISGDGMPDDWNDYLDNYYQVTESKDAEIKLPRAELAPDFKVTLSNEHGKELSLQELYDQCSKSIVAIKGYQDGVDGYYWGSGIILSENGYIITNAHVVSGGEKFEVVLQNGDSYAALVGADSTSDIAVLRIEATGLTPASFGDSAELAIGDQVAAIGNPLGETFRMTLTDGIISAIDRGISYNGHSMTLLQTNTAINEGNSGGALFNMYGQVIGVTNMKMMSSYSSIEGIGFAIPSSTIAAVADSLMQYGEVRGRTAIGITVGAIPENVTSHYDLPTGLYVSAVEEKSDAAAKGIQQGDIITAVNGSPASATSDILTVKNTLSVGDTITFTIWRDGETFDVDVTLVDENDLK